MKVLKSLIYVALIISFMISQGLTQESKHKPKPLTKQQMMMMKNMAMANMDKYMANMNAMKKLPMRIKHTQQEAIAYGKKLFNDPKALSTNGLACSSCHPGGGTTGGEAETPMPSPKTGKPYKLPIPSLIGAAATFPKYKVPNDAVITLGDMNNNCIMMFMAAQPLNPKSKEYKALVAYVTSLSNNDKVQVGKMPAMMMKMMGGKK